MNIDKLREELTEDEGCVFEIYLDHLGYPTFGIGHLIKESDPEHGQAVGTSVDKLRVHDCFEQDIQIVIGDCKKLYENFDKYPEDVQRILANMMFNMGYTRLSKFKNMKKALDNKDFKQTSIEMADSRWATQVPNRANRLINRMKEAVYATDGWDTPNNTTLHS